jgi:hypothetical protein
MNIFLIKNFYQWWSTNWLMKKMNWFYEIQFHSNENIEWHCMHFELNWSSIEFNLNWNELNSTTLIKIWIKLN